MMSLHVCSAGFPNRVLEGAQHLPPEKVSPGHLVGLQNSTSVDDTDNNKRASSGASEPSKQTSTDNCAEHTEDGRWLGDGSSWRDDQRWFLSAFRPYGDEEATSIQRSYSLLHTPEEVQAASSKTDNL